MKVKLSDITEAIEFTDDFSYYFLDATTGEVVFVNEMVMTSQEQEEAYDKLDEHGFYHLPDQRELNGYHTMESFIETLPSPVHEQLASSIIGRGAFRRFKDLIYRLDLEQEWYKYEEESNKRKAIEWCVENGIEYVDD